ncbi:MAG: von Willebrand factor type [Phenylobacterium sp.]|nr:von Willebrand factor type [Phenylobacterium sp.]
MRIRIERTGLLCAAKAWARDRSGATAVAFAIGFAVLAPVSLGVFDIYRSTQQRDKLQDALDAATLYAARSPALTNAEIDAVGDQAMTANLKLIDGAALLGSTFALSGTKVVSSASVSLPAFAPALFAHAPVSVGSQVERAMDKLEIALVLDNTGSMAGTKLSTLKTEAKKLVDKLMAAAARSSDPNAVKIALVPFSNTVRVQGTTTITGANYNDASHSGASIPTWIDPEAKSHWSAGRKDIFDGFYTDRFTMMRNINQNWAGCVEIRAQPYDVQEDPPSAANDTRFAPYFWPDEPDSSNFNQYMKDVNNSDTLWADKQKRAAKYTGGALYKSGNFTSTGMTYARGPNAGCTLQPVIRLTTDGSVIKTSIDNMNAIGETNIPMGLMWGWHAVTPNLPFGDGTAYNTPHTRKIIILMTDGENTNFDSGDSNDSHYGGLGFVWQRLSGLTENQSEATRTQMMDGRLSILCTNMKAKHVEIYTIRVEVSSGSSTLLQNCATSADKFYDVQNVATLGVAFDAIAGSITNLRISH